MPSLLSSDADSSSRVSTTRMLLLVPSSYSTGTSAHSSPSVYFTLPSERARRSASSAMRLDVPPMWKARRGGRGPGAHGAQGELRPGSADGLRGQNATCLAHVHHVHGGQVPAVAHPADAAPGL